MMCERAESGRAIKAAVAALGLAVATINITEARPIPRKGESPDGHPARPASSPLRR